MGWNLRIALEWSSDGLEGEELPRSWSHRHRRKTFVYDRCQKSLSFPSPKETTTSSVRPSAREDELRIITQVNGKLRQEVPFIRPFSPLIRLPRYWTTGALSTHFGQGTLITFLTLAKILHSQDCSLLCSFLLVEGLLFAPLTSCKCAGEREGLLVPSIPMVVSLLLLLLLGLLPTLHSVTTKMKGLFLKQYRALQCLVYSNYSPSP